MAAVYSNGVWLLLTLCSLPVLAFEPPDCPRIVSNIERLACFDQAAGTPAHTGSRQWSAQEHDAPILRRVVTQEMERAPGDSRFRLSLAQDEVMIWAPADTLASPASYLVISCVQNISRLQLVTAQPIDSRRVKVRLRGERGATTARPWQVMENGQVLDAGRGLPGIEQIKQLIGAKRIHVESDYPAVHGLVFDAQGLDPLIDEARKACRW
ncbi:type VI secretion system-associated protein VasI [Pseudomonas promysalinigenes]|uniref:type VI secretion system-associated protein VasI n=1 Tax=Pseudomonas promysalinigenes TaxID=485898 RepID=UPI00391715ED